MSHGRQRKEKNCLNCGAFVQGRYCQACGQENIEPKESFWSMLRHFFEDITHFDGKFFKTLKDLFFRPGFLSSEYIKGRRTNYLHPVRMYVFTSAIFFLVFFSVNNTSDINLRIPDDTIFTNAERDSIAEKIRKKIGTDPENNNLRKQLSLLKDTTVELHPADLIPYREGVTMISPLGKDYKTLARYDSAQHALPAAERDSWLVKLYNNRAYTINDKYRGDSVEGARKMLDIFLHRLPYLLFVSLPFFALILKLLYIRRKEYYYADHGIFSIHHYILSFILILLTFGFNKLDKLTGWVIWDFFIFAALIGLMVYLYLAMKKFYGQGRAKTFFKFFLLNIAGLILLLILILFFFLFSVFQL